MPSGQASQSTQARRLSGDAWVMRRIVLLSTVCMQNPRLAWGSSFVLDEAV